MAMEAAFGPSFGYDSTASRSVTICIFPQVSYHFFSWVSDGCFGFSANIKFISSERVAAAFARTFQKKHAIANG
jgi:hypothetical protein